MPTTATSTSTPTARAAAERTLPLRRRLAFGIAAVAAIGGAVATSGPVALATWAGLIGPDAALLAGLSREHNTAGRLAPRAVPIYNALHMLPGPVALAVAGAALGIPAVLGGGLAWLGHILVDRSMGYGLRSRDGRQRG